MMSKVIYQSILKYKKKNKYILLYILIIHHPIFIRNTIKYKNKKRKKKS